MPATAVPRISAAFLARERVRIGDRLYRQEYLCEFVETGDQLFRLDDIAAAVSDRAAPLFAERIFA